MRVTKPLIFLSILFLKGSSVLADMPPINSLNDLFNSCYEPPVNPVMCPCNVGTQARRIADSLGLPIPMVPCAMVGLLCNPCSAWNQVEVVYPNGVIGCQAPNCPPPQNPPVVLPTPGNPDEERVCIVDGTGDFKQCGDDYPVPCGDSIYTYDCEPGVKYCSDPTPGAGPTPTAAPSATATPGGGCPVDHEEICTGVNCDCVPYGGGCIDTYPYGDGNGELCFSQGMCVYCVAVAP